MLSGSESAFIKVPVGAKLLSSKITLWRPMQIQLWYMVLDDLEPDTQEIEIMVLGTGNVTLPKDVVNRLEFIDTAVCEEVREVYHIFVVNPPIHNRYSYVIPGLQDDLIFAEGQHIGMFASGGHGIATHDKEKDGQIVP